MFFRQIILIFIIGLSLHAQQAQTDSSENKEIQAYMLKGQLYELQEKQKSLEIAKQKNGLFVGGILGNATFESTPIENNNLHPLFYGARVGYQKYLNDSIAGLRFYGEYIRSDAYKVAYQLGSFNLDLLADMPLDKDKKYTLGAFGGVGMSWIGYGNSLSRVDFYGIGVNVNLGIALVLNIKHRFELEMKIPPIKNQQIETGTLSTTNIYLVSYNYLF
ncbi:outer membrane beta-barrel protein [Helicobacter sp. 11S03491-1]|uniref:outer membrane beta-barrel protein n=1 Tax=Helicobacter sp. 11S03491-1 TaxID=1476196 RepID=UPI000BA69082|nr:outer membrane beta-barrel protein [Helicobacter sp. 11S03491-1]PAF43329.1 hypothetical protein BKH45_01435 [Helicobacter sp. 11S03491-1]